MVQALPQRWIPTCGAAIPSEADTSALTRTRDYSGSMAKRQWLGMTAALVVAIAFFGTWQPGRQRPFDSPSVLAQVRQLHQLATVKYTVQKVIGLTEPKHPVGSESILLILQASVHAGVDLSQMKQSDLQVQRDGSIAVRLPAAQIFNVSVDEKETKVWDRRITWWTPWIPYSKDLDRRARIEGIEAIKNAALDMGILRQAEQNAESSIRTLLTLAGVKTVVVKAPSES